MPTSAADVSHLLRRAGFGGTPAEIAALTPLDLPAIVDRLFDFSANPPRTPPSSLTDPASADWLRHTDLRKWWLDRMRTAPAPLQEKIALFWHGHFATEATKVEHAVDTWDQNELFRTEGLGSFESLVHKVSLQVSMLVYLDNDRNYRNSPNENFARELLELFTLGVNQYTQDDVAATARAWTGHNVDFNAVPRRAYWFYPERHDTGNKTFLGVTRNWDGPEIITRVLTVEPQRSIAARFIAQKLWTYFAYSNPDSSLLDALTAQFVASSLNIGSLVRAIFLRPEFYSTTARRGLVRTPVEWVVGVLRATGLSAEETNPQWWMGSMGQQLFSPPNVAGWKNNAYWCNTTSLWARADFARNITWRARNAGFLHEIAQRSGTQHVMTPGAAIDFAYAKFGRDPAVEPVSGPVRQVLITWLQTQRATEFAPTYTWNLWAPINLTTMMMLCPDIVLA